MVIIGQVAPPTEGVVFTSDNVTLRIEQHTVGKGNVYISHSSLMWKPANEPEGMSISWKRIGVHGTASIPSKCICFVVDRHIRWPGASDEHVANGNGHAKTADTNGAEDAANGNSDNEDDDDEEEDVFVDAEEDQLTECWLLPDDVNIVDTMYQAMTECQELHPDSDDSISGDSDIMEYDEDGEGEFDDAGDYISSGNGDSGAVDNACAGMHNLSVDQFADAEE
ncbi:methylosome subunit pICln [Musca vetustissima]|uniref:methylosome subunit pICln n=1 Tax=Musca vetustissima TaxID=27455 RepID=UPI002AB7232E|nr:methylosome subunit pICln [Musca vetustissima]